MAQPLCKGLRLYCKDFLRARIALRPLRYERRGAEPAAEGERLFLNREGDFKVRLRLFAKGAARAPLAGEKERVDLRKQQPAREQLRFGEARAAFIDQRMPGKDHVLRRFVRPRAGVDIAGGKPRGVRPNQRAALGGLAGEGVAGRGIGDQQRARQRVGGAGRVRRPQILADLDRERKARHLPRAKEQIAGKGHRFAQQRKMPQIAKAGREVAQLVELGVVRQVGLGHHPERAPMLEHRRAVVEGVAVLNRKADDDQHPKVGRRLCDDLKPLECARKQRVV